MDKKSTKVSNLYGRARRIELVERIAYIVVGIIAVILVITLVAKQADNTDDNINFAYLRNYLEAHGYNCELIHTSGGQCVLSSKSSTHSFIRYDEGFEYFVRTKSYVLAIKHILSEEDYITLRTTSEAFSGYRNKEYKCSFKGSVLGELDKCVDAEENELNLSSYLGLIEQSIYELNNIVDSSGYYKDELIENYRWQKK